MYGIETIQSLNRKNAEAARTMAAHEVGRERDPHQSPDLHERQAHAKEVMDKILNGAKG